MKDPDTGKRRRVERKESEWVVTEMPELRIVPQDVWDAVKARQAQIRQESERLREALKNPDSRSHSGKYLLSGLLKCGCCGANFTIYGAYTYACASNINRGEVVCSNGLRVPRQFVEKRLIEAIRGNLFSEEAVETFVKETAALLKQIQAESQPNQEAFKRQLARAEKDIANIMAAIKAGIITPTTKTELQKAEADKAGAEQALKLEATPTEKLPDLLPRAIERYKSFLNDLGEVLHRDSGNVCANISKRS